MTPPPFIIGTALFFWGALSGHYLSALLLAIIMEGSRYTSFRVNFEVREFRMIWGLCSIFFATAVLYSLTGAAPPGFFFTVMTWLPAIFFPIASAQVYSRHDAIELSVFSMFYRKFRSAGPGDEPPDINVLYPYLALVITSASVVNHRGIWLYAGLAVFAFWVLWRQRPKSHSIFKWAISLSLALVVGFGGAIGLTKLQRLAEESFVNLYTRLFMNQPDPFTTNTSIGDIGRLKMSGQIMFRVGSSKGYSAPIYLPLSSYNMYKLGFWHASKAPLERVDRGPDEASWKLDEPSGSLSNLEISTYLQGGEGLILGPSETYKVERLPAIKMYANRLGSLKIGGA
ncbi:MAG: hypothetical protein OEZ04_12475, partial [Nitrospinota bacterium]|nr:hypothetical protein [Nitrospinota bacterium]